METPHGLDCLVDAVSSLKPSLVEWKRVQEVAAAIAYYALKPSLVEWKHARLLLEGYGQVTLKPSLVEWKPSGILLSRSSSRSLETFLSGMETRFRLPPGYRDRGP